MGHIQSDGNTPDAGGPERKARRFVVSDRVKLESFLPTEYREGTLRKQEREESVEKRESGLNRDLNPAETLVRAVRRSIEGAVGPFVSIFKTPKNLATAAVVVGAVAVATEIWSGFMMPALIATGIGLGLYQANKFRKSILSAETNAEKAESFRHLGESLVTLGLTLIGAKGHVGAAGLAAEEVGITQIALEARLAAAEAAEVAAISSEVAAEAAIVEGAVAEESLLADEVRAARAESKAAQLADLADVRVPGSGQQAKEACELTTAPSNKKEAGAWESWPAFFKKYFTKQAAA